MQQLKKIPIGIQGFESLIHDGYAYVDKTRFVHQLMNKKKSMINNIDI